MIGERHVSDFLPRAGPGDNFVAVQTAASEREAEVVLRALAAQDVACSLLRDLRLPFRAVEIRVRRSDLERARRIAKRFGAAAAHA